MNMLANIRSARRMGEMVSANGKEKRRTMAMPSLLTSLGSRSEGLPKPTPVNLRKFAETPAARRAINTIKDRIAGMNWRVQARKGRTALGEAEQRITNGNVRSANPGDSFRSCAEQVLEDVIVGGFGAAEIVVTGDEQKPVTL